MVDGLKSDKLISNLHDVWVELDECVSKVSFTMNGMGEMVHEYYKDGEPDEISKGYFIITAEIVNTMKIIVKSIQAISKANNHKI